jgi:hypothetical protein
MAALFVLASFLLPRQTFAASQETTVLWHPGAQAGELNAAKVVRIVPGFRFKDLALLRDDQMVQTQSGRVVRVALLRSVMIAALTGRVRANDHRARPLTLLPQQGPCDHLAPGTGLQQILARPDSDMVCFSSGRRASVAQIRMMAPLARRTGNSGAATTQSRVVTNAITLQKRDDLRKQLNGPLLHAPASTVLVSSNHHDQVTIGQFRSVLGDYGRQNHLQPAAPQSGGAR